MNRREKRNFAFLVSGVYGCYILLLGYRNRCTNIQLHAALEIEARNSQTKQYAKKCNHANVV